MISVRFLPILCVLFALALVPTLVHTYAFEPPPAGHVTAAIPLELAGYRGAPSERNENWGQRRFESDDWTERLYRSGADEVRLTVVRAYDAKRLYHHPELAVAYGTPFAGTDVVRAPARHEIPIHVLKRLPGTSASAMYVLYYDGRFIEDPLMFQLRTAGELLFSRRKPMTLFFMFDEALGQSGPIETQERYKVLQAAIDSYLGQSSGANSAH